MEYFLLKIWQGNFFDYNFNSFIFEIFFMWEVNLELQKKIRRLMYLKYRKHRKIANLSLACIFLYSILVFLILTRFCTIQFEIGNVPKICLMVFTFGVFIVMLAKSVDTAWLFWISMLFLFNFIYNSGSILHLFLLFLWTSVSFFILCFLDKKSISRDDVLLIYFIFFFIFLWPVAEASIDGIPIVAKIWKILFSLSPFLLLLFRSSFIDFLWSGYLIRRWFKIKDSEVWNCPGCHWYIMKKPVRFCPHCWCDSRALDTKSFVHVCKNCGSFMKIKETDFPNFCPHCGLAFKSKRPRTYS